MRNLRYTFQPFAGLNRDGIVNLAAFADHPDLRNVSLCKCASLGNITGLASCTGLRSLQLIGCCGLAVIPNTPAFLMCLSTLISIDLSHSSVANIVPLSSCTLLERCVLKS